MREINERHKKILNLAVAYGLNLDNLRKKYTLKFVIKLFNYLRKESGLGKENIYLMSPDDPKLNLDEYIEALKEAGFKLKRWVEDFVDEDTGEIVRIVRHSLKPVKSPYRHIFGK